MKLENSLTMLFKNFGSGIMGGILAIIFFPHIAIPLFIFLLICYFVITLIFIPDEPNREKEPNIIEVDYEEIEDD